MSFMDSLFMSANRWSKSIRNPESMIINISYDTMFLLASKSIGIPNIRFIIGWRNMCIFITCCFIDS